jgi:hypothetical protein
MKSADVKSVRRALGLAMGKPPAGPNSLSQSTFGELLGLSPGNARKSIERWESDGPTGPGAVALTYLGQGLPDEEMKRVLPEFVTGGRMGESGLAHDYVIRLWWPRFVAVVLPAEIPVANDFVWMAENVERLVVALWLDDPEVAGAPDRFDALRRAAALLEIETQDAMEEFDGA